MAELCPDPKPPNSSSSALCLPLCPFWPSVLQLVVLEHDLIFVPLIRFLSASPVRSHSCLSPHYFQPPTIIAYLGSIWLCSTSWYDIVQGQPGKVKRKTGGIYHSPCSNQNNLFKMHIWSCLIILHKPLSGSPFLSVNFNISNVTH